MDTKKAGNYFFILLKIIGWITGSLVGLFVFLFLILKIPGVQKKLGSYTAAYLTKTLDTKVEIAKITLNLPKSIQIKKIYIESLHQDTLWYSNDLKVNIDFFSLLKNRVEINSIYLEHCTAHIQKSIVDSSYNFDFIIQAFVNDQKDEIKTEEKGKAWDFSIQQVELKNIYFTLDDQFLQTKINTSLDYLTIDIDELDLENQAYLIDAVFLKGVHLVYESNNKDPETVEPDLESSLPVILVNNINMENINISYKDINGDQNLGFYMARFGAEELNLNLSTQIVELDRISLQKADVFYSTYAPRNEHSTEVTDKTIEQLPWMAKLNQIDLSEIAFKYQNKAEPELAEGIDFNNLMVSNFNFNATNIYFHEDSIHAKLNHLTLKDKSGFEIRELKTLFTLNPQGIQFSDLYLETGESILGNHLELNYPSMDAISDNLSALYMNVKLENSHVGFKDLVYFDSGLAKNQFFVDNKDKKITLNGKIEGLFSDIRLKNFTLGYSPSTNISVNGSIKGLPNYKQAFFNFDAILLNTTRGDLTAIVPDTLLPKEITIPEIIALNGNFKGTITDFNSAMNLNTSLGSINADVVLKSDTLFKTGDYWAHLSVINLDAGKFLKQEELLGKIELVASLKGSGLTLENMVANVDATVKKAVVNNYEYNDLRINGLFQQQNFSGIIKLEDENLAFDFDGNVDYSKELPNITANINLKGADLKALNFSKEDILLQGVLSAHIEGNNIDDLTGNIGIRDVLIIKNNQPYRIDSLLFVSVKEEKQKIVTLNSDFFAARFAGTINPSELGKVIQNQINSYFDLHLSETIDEQKLKPQDFKFEISVSEALILKDILVPGLQELQKIEIKGSYNSLASSINLQIKAPLVVYEQITVDSLVLNINSSDKGLTYSIFLNEISNPSLILQNPSLTGTIAGDLISTRFKIIDENNNEKFGFTALVKSIENEFTLHLLPGQVILNYAPWNLPSDNNIKITDQGFAIHNLVLEKDNQMLSINTKGRIPSDTLEIVFNNFNVKSLSEIIEKDNEPLYRGIIDGQVEIMGFQQEHIAFLSDLSIANLSYKTDTIGDVKIHAHNRKEDLYTINASIEGKGNEIKIEGTYAQQTQKLDFILDVRNLELGTVKPFVEQSITELSGSMRGNLLITGTVDDPDIDGTLNFQKTGFNLVSLNSYFTLKDELIFFDKKGINFRSVTLMDTASNAAVINGYILTKDYRQMFFDLNVTTANFLALNTSETSNEQYYGTIIVESDLRIRGNLDQPVINARINLKDGSDLTYIIPADEIAVIEREGIVEFIIVDKDSINSIMNKTEPKDTIRTEIRGIDLSANITIDKETKLRIVIDPATGDFIEVIGGGTMSFSMDPAGAMTLTGIYEINEGNYRLSFYDLVKRDFAIKPGSTITWTGDPLNAVVNISAIYTIRTSPSALMESQLGATDDQQQRSLNQPLPFEVYLNMRGSMLKPEIDFNIELPYDRKGVMDGTVNRRLQILNEQENELNKQVFALLVLNRFLPPDPLEAANGGGLTATARSSASKILTQQLNQFARKRVAGVEIAFDVELYEDATELQVDLERAFLDDRLRVEVGGRVDLEDRNRSQRSSDIVGDVAVEYNLTPDGRYRLRAFRKNEFQMLIDGDVVETGLSLIFTKDFDRFRDLFRRSNGNGSNGNGSNGNRKNGNGKKGKDESSELINSNELPDKKN